MSTYYDITEERLNGVIGWVDTVKTATGVTEDALPLPLSETYWDDLRAPAQGINPSGSPSAATVSTEDGTLKFGSTGDSVVTAWFQLPHNWKTGTDLMPHIHWYKATTSSAVVDWQLKYKWGNIGGVLPDWSALVAGTEVHDSNTAYKHSLTAFGTIDGAGKILSSMICLYLTRLGTGTTDTYAGDAHLMEIDLHYEIDGFGSDDEYSKEE